MRNPFNPYNSAGEWNNTACKCACAGKTALPDSVSVTMAYVPFQTDNTVYDADKALCAGTLFESLNKPFMQSGCCR